MFRFLTGASALLLLLAWSAEVCLGQQYQPSGPASPQNVSPYLNQLRGRSPAVNYLFGVAPFTQQSRFDARSLGQDTNALRRFNLEGPDDDTLPTLPET